MSFLVFSFSLSLCLSVSHTHKHSLHSYETSIALKYDELINTMNSTVFWSNQLCAMYTATKLLAGATDCTKYGTKSQEFCDFAGGGQIEVKTSCLHPMKPMRAARTSQKPTNHSTHFRSLRKNFHHVANRFSCRSMETEEKVKQTWKSLN